MKKLGKLSISPEKIMKNEDLINLKGGYGYCGHGYDTYYCTFSACSGCTPQSGTVCVLEGWFGGCYELGKMYPEMSSCTCDQIY